MYQVLLLLLKPIEHLGWGTILVQLINWFIKQGKLQLCTVGLAISAVPYVCRPGLYNLGFLFFECYLFLAILYVCILICSNAVPSAMVSSD